MNRSSDKSELEIELVQARWNGAVIAEADDVVIVDGYHYFPGDRVRMEHLQESDAITKCAWKGTAHYFDVIVAGKRNVNAAWHYPAPMPRASHVDGRIAFWKGVEVG